MSDNSLSYGDDHDILCGPLAPATPMLSRRKLLIGIGATAVLLSGRSRAVLTRGRTQAGGERWRFHSGGQRCSPRRR
jgi:hypothetical protein